MEHNGQPATPELPIYEAVARELKFVPHTLQPDYWSLAKVKQRAKSRQRAAKKTAATRKQRQQQKQAVPA